MIPVNSPEVIVYTGSLADTYALTRFYRRESANLRALRKLVISREKTVVFDVNGDGIEFPGLTYGNPLLQDLLEELSVIFTPQMLEDPGDTTDGVTEFRLSARHPWGEDRIL